MSTHAGADLPAPCSRSTLRGPTRCSSGPTGSGCGTGTAASTWTRSPGSGSSTSATAGRRWSTRWPGRPRVPYAVSNIFANAPAIALAEDRRLTPGDLDHVIFTSGGSEAVEVALKMARHYHVLRGEPDRAVFVSRWTNYHGATLGR